jgi:hypothetical protein
VSQDDPWGRLVPEWTRTRPRGAEVSPASDGRSDAAVPGPMTRAGDPASDGRGGVIDLRQPAEDRPEAR